MNIPAATRIDRDTSERAQRLRSRTFLTMSEMLRIGLLRVLEEFEATGNVSSGDGVPVANSEAQTSKSKLQTSTSEPPIG
ncbi:hypothetical protein [Verrucomicrobium sp. BvORR034]|uniref:hypothetical protein n=1 Tax=Verrucomicrobium sp. BvORR034 TaxID=1396418 RepID=UPI0006785AE4|nr:hypothetical protein [Verrucomicrobium sp. BvORR034]